MKLKNKVTIVTGGAKEGSIGRAIALEFANEGADIIIADLLEDSANELIKEISNLGRKCLFIRTDVKKPGDIKEMVSSVIKEYDRIDILANVAGISRSAKIVDVEEKDWDDIIDINLKGVFLCCKHAGRQMIKQGSGKIINLSSTAGLKGQISFVPYCISKAGVIRLTEGMALEMGPGGINVNAICPGPTDTDMMKDVFKDISSTIDITPEESRKNLEEEIPLRRLGKPEEVAKLAVFLASSDSDYITGQAITISGGYELILPGAK